MYPATCQKPETDITPEEREMSSDHEKLVVIGTGAAGLTAAIYAARANLNPLVLAGLQPGGQLTITTDVENYPGFADVVQGPWLMEQMQQQAENVGARVEYELVTDVDFSKRPFSMTLDGGKTMTADSVIIATVHKPAGSALKVRQHLMAAVFPPVPLVTGFSTVTVRWL